MSFGDLYDLATGKPKLAALSRPAAVPAPVDAPVAPPVEAPVDAPVRAPVTQAVIPPASAPVDAPVIASVSPPVRAAVNAPVTAQVEAAVTPPVNAEVRAPVTRAVTPPAKEKSPANRAPVGAPVTPAVTSPVTRVEAPSPARIVPSPRAEGAQEIDASSTPLDATHSSAEAKIYSVMYRGTHSRGTQERRFTVPELMKATGIRSDKTVRTALHGLAEKLSITVIDRNRSSNHGPLYRVHHPRDVMATRRRSGLRIDEQTKRIVGPVTAAVTGPVASPVSASVIAPANSTGAVTGRSLHVFHEHDHDMSAVRDAILQLVPSENDAAVEAAVTEISTLVAESIREAGKYAKQTPATAAYAVECVRRSIAGRTKKANRQQPERDEPQATVESGEDSSETVYTLLSRVADQYRHSHPDATEDAVVERLHDFVRREGWDVTDDDLRKALERE